jgi:hypothetical protein
VIVVIAGLDPAIHSVTDITRISVTEWMPESSPGMTTSVVDTSLSGRRRKNRGRLNQCANISI